jgi:hypothetical protein
LCPQIIILCAQHRAHLPQGGDLTLQEGCAVLCVLMSGISLSKRRSNNPSEERPDLPVAPPE